MRKKYSSDITPEKFEEIRPLLQSVRRRTKPTTVDLYEVRSKPLLKTLRKFQRDKSACRAASAFVSIVRCIGMDSIEIT